MNYIEQLLSLKGIIYNSIVEEIDREIIHNEGDFDKLVESLIELLVESKSLLNKKEGKNLNED